MQANEPTSSEYNHIACDATQIITDVSDAIVRFTKYARRMYGSISDVDNDYLAGACDDATRSLANLGSNAERIRLYALNCEIEAKLREEKDQQNHPVEDEEAEE